MMKRTTGILCVLALLLSFLPSCSGGGTKEQAQTQESAAAVTTAEAEPATTAVTCDAPKEDYKGYEFRFMGQPQPADRAYHDLHAEEETGNAINDAVYKRNMLTEEYFNVKITYRDENSPQNVVNTSVAAGDDAFDAVYNTATTMLGNYRSGYLLDVGKMKYLDTAKPWWTTDVIETSKIAGKAFMLVGDCLTRDKDATWCLIFNKRLYKDLGLDEPYDLVRSGKWTLDVLEKHCSDVTKDLNGDGVLDWHDHWGMLSSDTAVIGLVSSCNIYTFEKAKDGSAAFSLNTARNVDALQKLFAFCTNSSMELRANDITGVSDIWKSIKQVFQEGRGLYRISILKDALDMRDMEDDFGIIPLPKYDEQQEEYVTTYQWWNARALAVPVTVESTDRTGAVLEYFTYASHDTVREAYYDVTLAGKLARDKDSTEMLDLIFNALTADLGLMTEIGGVRNMIVNMMKVGAGNISSTLASNTETVTNAMKELYETIDALQ